MKKINIHNHTRFSDGQLTVEEIIREAKKCLDVVGISDHYETSKVNSVPATQLDKYIKEIRKFKDESEVKVLVGVEVDFSGRTLIDNIPKSFSELDYALFEYVNDFENGGYPLSMLLKLREKFRVYFGLAHTDIVTSFKDIDYEVVLSLLEHHDIFVELNTSNLYTKFGEPYYRLADDFFSKLSEYEVGIAVGTDTHSSIIRVCDIGDAYKFIKEKNLQENLEIFIKKLGL